MSSLSLYKYLPEQFVNTFVNEGAILFRALSYFRDYEDAQVRGDDFEGTRIHRPTSGLEITMTKTGERIVLPHSFEAAANEDDIFVFCLSTSLSPDLAEQFQANTCVEINCPIKLISGVRAALARRPSIKNKMLVHDKIKYYAPEQPPIVDWALPERIAMSKLNSYEWQNEYRLAFSTNGAFDVENTRLRLVTGERRHPKSTYHPQSILKIGSLARVCKIHRF